MATKNIKHDLRRILLPIRPRQKLSGPKIEEIVRPLPSMKIYPRDKDPATPSVELDTWESFAVEVLFLRSDGTGRGTNWELRNWDAQGDMRGTLRWNHGWHRDRQQGAWAYISIIGGLKVPLQSYSDDGLASWLDLVAKMINNFHFSAYIWFNAVVVSLPLVSDGTYGELVW